MRKVLPPLSVVLLIGLFVGWIHKSIGGGGNHIKTDGPSIDRFVELSSLLTIRLDVVDVLMTRISGRTGGVSVAVLLKGDAALGIDLSQARFQNVDVAHRAAVLVLPPPTVFYAGVDHQRTKLFALSSDGLWMITPETQDYLAVIDKAMADSQDVVTAAARAPDANDRARHHAEILLSTFFRSIGYQTELRWADR